MKGRRQSPSTKYQMLWLLSWSCPQPRTWLTSLRNLVPRFRTYRILCFSVDYCYLRLARSSSTLTYSQLDMATCNPLSPIGTSIQRPFRQGIYSTMGTVAPDAVMGPRINFSAWNNEAQGPVWKHTQYSVPRNSESLGKSRSHKAAENIHFCITGGPHQHHPLPVNPKSRQ